MEWRAYGSEPQPRGGPSDFSYYTMIEKFGPKSKTAAASHKTWPTFKNGLADWEEEIQEASRMSVFLPFSMTLFYTAQELIEILHACWRIISLFVRWFCRLKSSCPTSFFQQPALCNYFPTICAVTRNQH